MKEKKNVSFYENMYRTGYSNWTGYYGNGSNDGGGNYSYDFDSKSSKRKHEFSPILLINSTVYDCVHCKRKKEDCNFEYCVDEDNSPSDDWWDTGGW